MIPWLVGVRSRQEVQRVQKAVEAEWSAKLQEAKRKAEVRDRP